MKTHTALALLEWQIELGADEAISETPVDRYALQAPTRKAPKPATPAPAPKPVPDLDPVAVARSMAAQAGDLDGLRAALGAFEHCDLKRGARNLVFCDGQPGARVMIIGEAPGRDEDIAAKPFVGPAGRLLDQMFAAIGMARDAADPRNAIYITNIVPWRPPQNRDPNPAEIAMMMPFVRRHVELAAPDIIVAMGNVSCQGLLSRKGILRMRGTWETALERPVLPMVHPAYLLRNPIAKREAWADLLSLQARLREGG